jgi:uncharacterized lipoprotein YmbA
MLVLVGCSTGGTQSAYYAMQPVQMATQVEGGALLSVGIGPVNLPSYLDRDAIVTRLSPNRLMVNDAHRWAGSLKGEILRILATNLKAACPQVNVRTHPWAGDDKPDIRFRVTVQNFEGRRAADVDLKVAWSVEDARSDLAPMQRETHIRQAIDGDDFESLTVAMGLALAGLSREMAKDVGFFAKEGGIAKPLNF